MSVGLQVWQRLDNFRALKRRRKKIGGGPIVGVLGAWGSGQRDACAFRANRLCPPDVSLARAGCMAERLKTKLLESDKLVDLVAGPDAYRDLPSLIGLVQVALTLLSPSHIATLMLCVYQGGDKAVNVQLSQDETYADIAPVRPSGDRVRASCFSLMVLCNDDHHRAAGRWPQTYQ